MKHCFFIMVMIMSALRMSAYYEGVEFTYTDGSTLQIESTGLVITVNGGNLLITNTAGENFAIDATDLMSMQFIGEVEDPEPEPEPEEPDSGIKAIDTANTEVTVYSLAGVGYGKYSNIEEARKDLPNGVYVLKATTGATIKIVIRK